MKLYSYGCLSAIMIHTSTHPCMSNSTIPARQKIRQSHITSLAFALPDWLVLLPYEQYLSVTPKCADLSRAHPASYSIDTKVLSQGVKWSGVRRPLTCIMVPRLRMSGAVYPPLLYAFTTWTMTTLHLPSCKSTTWAPFECTRTHFESWCEINLNT